MNGGMGERIEILMRQEELTQKELSNMVGVTESAMSRYLNNQREPKIEVIANLASALNTTTDYLINGKQDYVNFEDTYRLVARGAKNMTDQDKMKLMGVLLSDS